MLSIYTNIVDYNNNVFESSKQTTLTKNKKVNTLFDFDKLEKKFDNIMPQFYTIDFNSIDGKNYVNDYSKNNINIDKKIGNTKQVKNDCWLLTGVNALANTKAGKDYIKKAIINHSGDNTIVYFKGVNTTITIPRIVLGAAKQSNRYVKGDDDMLAIELAAEYYKKMLIINNEAMKNSGPNVINGKHSSGNLKDPLAGGFSSDIIFLLTGKFADVLFNIKNGCSKQIKDVIAKKQKSPDKYALTCNFRKAENGLFIHHAYAIKNVDSKYVTLINPHDSGKEKKVLINDFYSNVASITCLDVQK